MHQGEDAADHFDESLIQIKEELCKKLLTVEPMKLTKEEEQSFQRAKTCSICRKPLEQKTVRDHDHVTTKYSGSAHPFRNLHFKQTTTIPSCVSQPKEI